jgi:hypothetical protein
MNKELSYVIRLRATAYEMNLLTAHVESPVDKSLLFHTNYLTRKRKPASLKKAPRRFQPNNQLPRYSDALAGAGAAGFFVATGALAAAAPDDIYAGAALAFSF